MTTMNFLGLESLDFPLKNQFIKKKMLKIGKNGRKTGFSASFFGIFPEP